MEDDEESKEENSQQENASSNFEGSDGIDPFGEFEDVYDEEYDSEDVLQMMGMVPKEKAKAKS